MTLIILVILIYPMLAGVTVLILNDRCLLPGTTNYKYRQLERRESLETERSRSAAIRSRYLAHENESIENRILQISR